MPTNVNMSSRRLLFLSGVIGLTGVMAGTFGAHGLRGRVSEHLLETFEIGVRYQLLHAAALVACTALAMVLPAATWIRAACWLWGVGVLLFSGSLYTLAVTNLRWLGWITPLGGVAFIAGWLCLCAWPLTTSRDLSSWEHHS